MKQVYIVGTGVAIFFRIFGPNAKKPLPKPKNYILPLELVTFILYTFNITLLYSN